MEPTSDPAPSAQAGDGARFTELYERIAPALYTWAEVRIRPELRSFVDPQDVVQEVWCRAWKAFRGFDPASQSFRYWLFRVAKNVMLEVFRELRSPDGGVPGGDPSKRLLVLRDVPDSATAVSQRLARDERLKLFAQWIGSLEEDERLLVVHLGLEGMTQAEVAARLSLSRDAIAKRWQRLLSRVGEQGVMRELLAEAG
ncbi:MAG: sigma-70 family RNA polymerase sigma factor [Planctomycetes bacterium]|nr:sigma-70 family RNA polymerase sigma factor [Planctomycetota bacterium]